MKSLSLLLAIGLLAWGCSGGQPEAVSEKSVDEIKSQGEISSADIIRSPVTANEPLDTNNVAKISFKEDTYNFGEVNEGEIVEYAFAFTNTGNAPMIINNARSTCGCTVPEWPKEPIPPGGTGLISVRFDTQNKPNKQTKPVTITANTYPATTRVYLSGFVRPKPGGSDAGSGE
jgi:hypothetical protein